ncbi:MAG: TolC family protein [Phycisphaerales bacterium]|nr:TolC family protein [Phycisphaerales bacterium]
MNYKIKTSVLISLLTINGTIATFAQSTKSITLTEAVQLGIRNSKLLLQSQAKSAIAEATLKQFKERRLPNASIAGSYLRVTKPTLAVLFNTNSSDSSGSAAPDISQATYALANVSYTLFDGFKNSAAIQSARYLKQATAFDETTDRQQVMQNIIAAYANLFKANNSMALVKDNLNQAHQRMLDFERLEQNGLIARNDLLKVKLQESNIQLSLLDAESDLHIANLNMNLLLGLDEKTVLVLDSSSFVLAKESQSLSYWEQQAADNRADYKAIGLRLKAANENIKSAKGGYYPSLSLIGGYVALNVPNLIRVSDAWNGGIGLKYNISSLWKTGSEVNLAKAQMMQTQAAQDLLSDQIKLQLYQSYEAYLLSIKKIEVFDVAIQQANENYKIMNNKYKNSLATTTDLLDADVQQLQARLNLAYANADAVVAYHKLLQAAGILQQ